MLSSKTSNHVKEKTFNIPAKILKDLSSSIQIIYGWSDRWKYKLENTGMIFGTSLMLCICSFSKNRAHAFSIIFLKLIFD